MLKILRTLISLTLVFLIFSCQNDINDTESSKYQESENQNVVDEYRYNFKNQQETLRDKLIGRTNGLLEGACQFDSLNVNNCLIFVVRNTDCQSCLELSQNFLRKIQNSTEITITSFIIGSSNLLDGRINTVNATIDEQQKLVGQLGYFKTPAMIGYKRTSGISDIYIVPVFEDSLGLGNFSDNLLNSLNKP